MFIDYNKAFDSLFHGKIWEALAKQDIPEDVIRLLSILYKNSVDKVNGERSQIGGPPITKYFQFSSRRNFQKSKLEK